jgi:hypothetical protein
MSSAENKLDFFEVGDKTSLICAELDVSEVVRTTLRELGFKFHTADTSDLAIELTRYNPYDIIIVQENFAGSSLKSNPVLSYLSPLSMTQRRYSMIVLIGTEFKTLDAMQAFGQSVQLVVNVSDLPNFTAILKKSWAEFTSMYRIYKEVFATVGEK